MDHHQGLAVQLVEMIMVIEIKVSGKANVHEHEINEKAILQTFI